MMNEKSVSLYLDTSSSLLSVALFRAEESLGKIDRQELGPHSKHLVFEISRLLREQDLEVSDLDFLTVVKGPGSFTGLRIGLAATKALSLAYNIPIVPMSTLEALAAQHFGKSNKVLVPCIHARANEVFVAAFAPSSTLVAPQILFSDGVVLVDHLKTKMKQWGQCLVFGGGALNVFSFLNSENEQVLPENNDGHFLDLHWVHKMALHRFQKGMVISAGELRAHYLRKFYYAEQECFNNGSPPQVKTVADRITESKQNRVLRNMLV